MKFSKITAFLAGAVMSAPLTASANAPEDEDPNDATPTEQGADPCAVNPCAPPHAPPQPQYQPPPQTYQPPPAAEYNVAGPCDEVGMYSYAWHDCNLQSGIGVQVLAGGGVNGFENSTMQNVSTNSVQGIWNVKVTIGSHIPLGVDLAYTGSAGDVNGLFGPQTGTLIGTAFTGSLRWNVLPHAAFTPYVYGGVGWQNYQITNSNRTFTLADSGMNSSDNSVIFPTGLGVQWRDRSGLVIDAHGAFNWNVDAGLVLNPDGTQFANTNNDFLPMHTWEAGANIGFEW